MTRIRGFVVALAILFFASGARADDPAGGSVEPPDPGRIREAVLGGLRIVEKAARSYPEHRSCFSCHHQTLPMLAVATARSRGLDVDRDLLGEQARFTLESFRGRRDGLQEGKGIGGAALTVAYGLWALEIARSPRDETTSAMVTFLLRTQRSDGSWRRSTSRPPLEDSNITCTILAVYFMRKFATDDQRDAVEAAVARAREWLPGAVPESHEDRVSRLGALPLLGAAKDEVDAALRDVLAAQRDDGGWAQLPDMSSDAYATGLTLFTLERIGVPASHPAYRRGVLFLLETQCDDGSWFVKSRSKPIQTLFDNGDPHGTDGFISIPATSWATTALALALPPPKRERF